MNEGDLPKKISRKKLTPREQINSHLDAAKKINNEIQDAQKKLTKNRTELQAQKTIKGVLQSQLGSTGNQEEKKHVEKELEKINKKIDKLEAQNTALIEILNRAIARGEEAKQALESQKTSEKKEGEKQPPDNSKKPVIKIRPSPLPPDKPSDKMKTEEKEEKSATPQPKTPPQGTKPPAPPEQPRNAQQLIDEELKILEENRRGWEQAGDENAAKDCKNEMERVRANPIKFLQESLINEQNYLEHISSEGRPEDQINNRRKRIEELEGAIAELKAKTVPESKAPVITPPPAPRMVPPLTRHSAPVSVPPTPPTPPAPLPPEPAPPTPAEPPKEKKSSWKKWLGITGLAGLLGIFGYTKKDDIQDWNFHRELHKSNEKIPDQNRDTTASPGVTISQEQHDKMLEEIRAAAVAEFQRTNVVAAPVATPAPTPEEIKEKIEREVKAQLAEAKAREETVKVTATTSTPRTRVIQHTVPRPGVTITRTPQQPKPPSTPAYNYTYDTRYGAYPSGAQMPRPESRTANFFGLSAEMLDAVKKVHEDNVKILFSKDPWGAWGKVKHGNAADLMKSAKRAEKPLQNYLKRLSDATHLEPSNGIPGGTETIEEFVKRALQFAASKDSLEEVKLEKK